MKAIDTIVFALLAIGAAMPAAAQPSRLYDKDVKPLLEQSKQSFERFWDALDNR